MSTAASPDDELAAVRAELAELRAQLRARGDVAGVEQHELALEQLRLRFEHRFAELARAHSAAATLRRLTTPGELLAQAPRALCEGTGLDRALVSAVAEGSLVPLAAHYSDDRDAGEDALAALRAEPVALEHRLVESDAMRRRRATLVTNVEISAKVDQRLAQALGCGAYVAAPLLSGATVIGLLHASRLAGEPLDVLDRDVLWEFTTVLSQIHESAELRRTLRRERDELRRFLEWLNARSVSLADAPIAFGAYLDAEPLPAIVIEPAGPAADGAAVRDDRLVFAGLLTRRELDVLRLLAEGGTNRTIADALVLSDTTVKFHVGSILRKLRVANRAEAVARYLSMLGAGT